MSLRLATRRTPLRPSVGPAADNGTIRLRFDGRHIRVERADGRSPRRIGEIHLASVASIDWSPALDQQPGWLRIRVHRAAGRHPVTVSDRGGLDTEVRFSAAQQPMFEQLVSAIDALLGGVGAPGLPSAPLVHRVTLPS